MIQYTAGATSMADALLIPGTPDGVVSAAGAWLIWTLIWTPKNAVMKRSG